MFFPSFASLLLQGTIASMFNIHTKLGKLYVFDIQRTYREVYDHARRVLHAKGVDITSAQLTHSADLDGNEFTAFNEHGHDSTLQTKPVVKEVIEKMEKEVAERISEAITCRICMDCEIDTSFSPCGHITSCSKCAKKYVSI